MKKILKYSFAVALVTIFSGCSLGEFDDEVEITPDAAVSPFTSTLLTSALRSLPGTVTETTGSVWIQHIANSYYQDGTDDYATREFSFSGWYSGPLSDLQKIISINEDPDLKSTVAVLDYGLNENQIAVAKILMSYYYIHMTDRWGMIPYSEALQAIITGEPKLPKYDDQQSIYTSIFAVLKQANSSMIGATDGNLAKGDFFFDGDLDKWKMFANTLRMNMALRLSEVDPATGKTEFLAALADGVISSNAENITYVHLAESNNQNPWYARFITRKDWVVANTLVDWMQVTTYTDPHTLIAGKMDVIMDPRLPVFANDTEDTKTDFIGMVYGIGTAAAGEVLNTETSFLGDAMRKQNAPTQLFTYAQVLFSQAEAALLGWTTDDPEALYYEGILASLGQYGVDADYATYITNSKVVYDVVDPAVAYEQIMTQKWMANFLNGYEAWADWRRTGFPVLAPAPAAKNTSDGGIIPIRQGYGGTTLTLNTTNYNAAVAIQGADELGTPVWWDK